MVQIDQLLPDHCRGLRARLYHVLMLPTTIMSKVLLQQQLLDEGHVLSTADSMVGLNDAKLLYTIGYESLKETGIVPSGIPNTVLFNNVAYIKPVTVHPALATVTALGVATRVEQPVRVVNRVYSSYPTPDAGPMFYRSKDADKQSTSFEEVPTISAPVMRTNASVSAPPAVTATAAVSAVSARAPATSLGGDAGGAQLAGLAYGGGSGPQHHSGYSVPNNKIQAVQSHYSGNATGTVWGNSAPGMFI